ncbi:MAG: peptidoglycan-binding protein [Candidatus Sericytochromatia bacterium]
MNNNQINYGQQLPMASTVPVQGAPPQMYAPQPQPAPGYYAPQPSYGVDQTNFSAPRPIAPPAPAVEVGIFDKVKSYFNDVYRSDDNLRAYKVFQQQVDTDANTIKPGSNDRARVTDLQQKLNMAGVSANVNGVYGYATGEAVKDFKRMMNINDGFLDGNGQPAVTDIATPQMQTVLNSVVSKKLNPQMPGTGNPMPVTQEELMWAQNLATRVQNFGYQPNQQERSRYDDILARQNQQQTPGLTPPPQSPAVPGIPVPGQPPVYQQPVQPAPAQPSNIPMAPVTQQELDWAMQMQERIVGGYRPTAQEAAAYENIQQRYAAQPAQPAQPTPQPSGQLRPVTQEELNWALQMQDRITKGYSPTPDEAAKYTDIFNRYQNQPTQAEPAAPAQPVYNPGTTPTVSVGNTVTQEELKWAMELQQKVDTGYKPTQQEIIRYTDVYNRYQNSQQTPPAQPAAPVAPAQPSAPVAPVQPAPPVGSVGQIVLGYAHPRGTMHVWNQAPKDPSGLNGPTGNWSVDKNRLSYLSPDGSRSIAQNDLNNTNARQLNSQWRLMYTPPAQGQQPAAPVAPQQPGVSRGATADEIQWARQLESRVAQGHQANQQEISRYNEIQMKLATYGMAPAAPTAPAVPTSTGPVSQAEIDWAMQLQHKVQFENYQPTEQEVAAYTDIYSRYQQQQAAAPPAAPVAPVAPAAPAVPAAPVAGTGAPTPEELQWAQQLQTMVQQGYQATEQEIAKYTDIFNRMQQASGPAPAAPPAAPAAPAPAAPQAPGTVMINVGQPDMEMQWALELLNRYRQGYQPSQSELMMYERIIASKAVPGATP